jgi:chemotaxis response regulator CheB
LRLIKKYGGTALVPHPEDATIPFMPRAAIAAGYSDANVPVQTIVRFLGSFCSRYRTPPSGFHHWRVAQEVP